MIYLSICSIQSFYGIESLKQIIHFTKRKRDEESFTEFDVDVKVENIKNVKSQQNFNAAKTGNILTTNLRPTCAKNNNWCGTVPELPILD